MTTWTKQYVDCHGNRFDTSFYQTVLVCQYTDGFQIPEHLINNQYMLAKNKQYNGEADEALVLVRCNHNSYMEQIRLFGKHHCPTPSAFGLFGWNYPNPDHSFDYTKGASHRLKQPKSVPAINLLVNTTVTFTDMKNQKDAFAMLDKHPNYFYSIITDLMANIKPLPNRDLQTQLIASPRQAIKRINSLE